VSEDDVLHLCLNQLGLDLYLLHYGLGFLHTQLEQGNMIGLEISYNTTGLASFSNEEEPTRS
jgi:hypothetical protein